MKQITSNGGTPDLVSDGDGVSNGIEHILGGTGLSKDVSLQASTALSGANNLFTFKRIRTSINANTSITIQVGTTPQNWPGTYNVGADTATSSPEVTVQKNAQVDTIPAP